MPSLLNECKGVLRFYLPPSDSTDGDDLYRNAEDCDLHPDFRNLWWKRMVDARADAARRSANSLFFLSFNPTLRRSRRGRDRRASSGHRSYILAHQHRRLGTRRLEPAISCDWLLLPD